MAELPKIVSVDDHVVEPAHVWQTWLPEKHRALGPRIERRHTRGQRARRRRRVQGGLGRRRHAGRLLDLRGPAHHGAPADVRRGRVPARRDGTAADDLRRDAPRLLRARRPASTTWTSTGSRRRCASRRSRASAARRSSRPRTASSRSRACRPTTTGWSRSGAATPAAASSRSSSSRCGTPSSPPPRSGATPRAACARSRSARSRRNLGLPSIHSGEWDPFFQACDETGTVDQHARRVVVEDAGHRPRRTARGRAHADVRQRDVVARRLAVQRQARCSSPNLRLAYSEGQIGWIPYVLERADDVWEQHRAWAGVKDTVPEPPSTYYYRSVYGCFFHDEHGIAVARPKSAWTTSPSRPTTRTPTRPGPTPRRSPSELFADLDDDRGAQDRARQRDPHARSSTWTRDDATRKASVAEERVVALRDQLDRLTPGQGAEQRRPSPIGHADLPGRAVAQV